MWTTIKRCLIAMSVTLNLVFAGVWLTHAVPSTVGGITTPEDPATAGRIACPLHEQLELTEEQWAQIEPRLRKFQDSAQAVRRDMNRLRLEIMDQIAATEPDREVILSRQEQIEVAQRTMQALFVEHILAEKAILSRGQQDRLFTFLRQQHVCDHRQPMTMSGRRTARSVAPSASNDHCRD